MLAITAGKRLRLIEPSVLKSATNSPSRPLPQTALDVELTSLAWTPDNSSLVVSTENTIRRYDAKGHLKKILYSLEDEGRIAALVVKDDTTIIFANGTTASIYNCSSNAIEKTFQEHASNISCMTLSNDSSLLAISSSTACTIENLTLGSRTNLSGLPCISITACSFHLHSSTRLLLGVGKQVLVYDVTKPSSPMKAISLASKASGDIVAIACSPFSKTLTAVACSGGVVGLVDLEKEKALFKTIDFKTTLTSVSFTADGASLLVGTASGELLIQDLRSLDKPPRKLTVGSSNERILGMSVQHKPKTVTSSKGTLKSNATIKSNGLHDTTNVDSPPTRRVSSSNKKAGTPSSKPSAIERSPANPRGTPNGTTPRGGRKSGLSVAASTPVGGNRKGSTGISPLNVSENFENTSLQLETLPPMPSLPLAWKAARKKLGTGIPSPSPPKPRTGANAGGKFATARASAMDSVSAVMSKAVASPSAATMRVRTLTAAASRPSSTGTVTGTRKLGVRGTLKPAPTTASSAVLSSAQRSPTSSTSSTTKGASRSATVKDNNAEKENTATENKSTTKEKKQDNKSAMRALGVGRLPSSRPVSALASRASSTTRTDSGRTRTTSATSTAVASSRGASRAGTNTTKKRDELDVERTPSPELPSMTMAMSPVRPVYKGVTGVRRASGASAKEAMISEVEMFDGEDGEVRGWVPNSDDLRGGSISEDEDEIDDVDAAHEQLPTSTCNALQVSPIRGISNSRPSAPPSSFPTPSKLPLSQATDLLRALLAESLLEFRDETRNQMRGLHLDLLRVGRGMKKEVREIVGEMLGEMEVGCNCKAEVEALKEENERLKEEVRRMGMGMGTGV